MRKLRLWFLDKFSLYTPETSKHIKSETGGPGAQSRGGYGWVIYSYIAMKPGWNLPGETTQWVVELGPELTEPWEANSEWLRGRGQAWEWRCGARGKRKSQWGSCHWSQKVGVFPEGESSQWSWMLLRRQVKKSEKCLLDVGRRKSVVVSCFTLNSLGKCIGRWMDKENVDTKEYYSDVKKWNLAICNNMDGSRGYYAKWNKSEKDKYLMVSLVCRVHKNKTKQKHTHRYREQTGVVREEEGEGVRQVKGWLRDVNL